MRTLVTSIAAAVLASFVATASSQTCQQQVGVGTPDAAFNALFTQNGPGWTGGDSTYSRALPDGRTLFFFSDSFLASSPVPNGATVDPQTRMRTNPIFQGHNSIVVVNTDNSVATLYGGDSLNPTSLFAPENTNDLYWMGDSLVVQPSPGNYQLELFLLEFNSSTYSYVGSSVATLSLPDLTVESIQPLAVAGNIEWGSSLLEHNGEVYIYGIEDLPTGKYPHLARAKEGDVANPGAWQYWSGADWVSDSTSSARILDGPDSISNEFNVNLLHTAAGNSYMLTAMDTSVPFGTWKSIVVYFSCSPQGPWSAKQVIYSTPETGTSDHSGLGTMLTYNPHAHFEYASNGTLLISYDLNTTNGNDLIYADDYRPKFIRVPIAGLQ